MVGPCREFEFEFFVRFSFIKTKTTIKVSPFSAVVGSGCVVGCVCHSSSQALPCICTDNFPNCIRAIALLVDNYPCKCADTSGAMKIIRAIARLKT